MVKTRPLAFLTHDTLLAWVVICNGGSCGHGNLITIPVEHLQTEWLQRRIFKEIGLTFTNCMGLCSYANVISIVTKDSTCWLGKITDASDYEDLLDWATASAKMHILQKLPLSLQSHRFERFK